MQLTAAPDKTLRRCQDFSYQFRRSGFRVGAQQRLCSRSAEQYPCFGSIAVRWGVEEKLDAIEIFFLQHVISPESQRALGPRPLDGILFHLFGNMQIAPPVLVGAEFTLQIRNQLAERLALLRHNIRQQQAIQDAIALRQKA